ncbi:MAG: DedA family protein [Planctomycetota bacterium]
MLDLIVQKASYFGFIAFLALCGLGLPIPEEAPLILAGVLSRNGTLEHPSLAFAACLVGAVLGDSLMYFIGRRLGHGYLRKHPRFARFIDPEKEAKFEAAVTRHGFKLVLLTRFLIGVRGPVYFAAGAARVPYLRFLLWDAVSATMVVSVVFGLGYYYGEQIAGWVTNVEWALTVLALLGAGAGGVVFYRQYKARLSEAIDRLSEPDEGANAAAGEANSGDDAAASITPDDREGDKQADAGPADRGGVINEAPAADSAGSKEPTPETRRELSA